MRPRSLEPLFLVSLLVVLPAVPGEARAQAAIRRQHEVKKDRDLPRFREVIGGALYRSGAPTEEGLLRVCRAGFARVYSLYGPRTTARGPRNEAMLRHGLDRVRCVGPDGPREIEWRSASSSRERSLPSIFRDVVEAARDSAHGPVLIHCWNGLHYAGMVAAMALRQFCGFSAEAAEAYWWSTTSQGARYPHVIRRIRAFRSLPDVSLPEDQRRRLCPVMLLKPERRPEARLSVPHAH